MKNRVDFPIRVGAAFVAAAGACWICRRFRRALGPEFSGQVIVITGGSRGLGLEMARLWADEGARVAICARTQRELERAAREFAGRGQHVLAIPCDVTGIAASLINRVSALPERPTTQGLPGRMSFSKWSPSILTVLNEQAAVRNNELG